MAISSLTILEETFGESALPELVVAVQRTSDARLADFAERLLTQPPQASPAPESELWPVISARLGVVSTPRGPVGAPSRAFVDVLSASDPRFSGTGLFSSSVLRALLYCHGLVLEDPLLLAADMYTSSSVEHRTAARKFLEAAVLSLVEIAPLLRAGVVETFFASDETRGWADQASDELSPALANEAASADVARAFEALYVDGLHPKLQQLWRVVRSGDEPSDSLLVEAIGSDHREIAEAFIEIAQDMPPTAVAETVFDAVAHSLGAVRQLGGVHDLLLPPGVLEVLVATQPPAGSGLNFGRRCDRGRCRRPLRRGWWRRARRDWGDGDRDPVRRLPSARAHAWLHPPPLRRLRSTRRRYELRRALSRRRAGFVHRVVSALAMPLGWKTWIVTRLGVVQVSTRSSATSGPAAREQAHALAG